MAGSPEPPKQLLDDASVTEGFLERHFAGIGEPHAPRLASAMAHAALGGGKRFRAALVLGAARLAEKAAGSNVKGEGRVRVAAAIECLHAYSLIHDDLPAMDNAETRRGKPACHVAFDEATAILAGDALQSLAFEFLSGEEPHPDPSARADLVRELAIAAGVQGMASGQTLDLEAESRKFDLEETGSMQMMKTGALIRAAALCGGIYGGADRKTMDALREYALRVGIVYQISDDILDRTASADALGKPANRDDQAGKSSYVGFLGMEGARAEAVKNAKEAGDILSKAVGKPSPELDYLMKLASFSINRAN